MRQQGRLQKQSIAIENWTLLKKDCPLFEPNILVVDPKPDAREQERTHRKSNKMIKKECQIFRFLTISVFLGTILLFASCGQSLESHLERGEEFLKQRKYEAALMQFRAAAEIDELSPEAHWGLARAYERQEKFLETIEALRRVVDFAPERLDAQSKLANYYLLFNPPQIQEAEKILAEIFKRDKKFIEGHILKAVSSPHRVEAKTR